MTQPTPHPQRPRDRGIEEGKAMTWIVNHGDCLDPVTGLASLPDRSVDHVITDPPYSERVHARLGREGRRDGTDPRSALSFGHMTAEVANRIAAEACRVSRRWFMFFCDELTFPLWVAAIEAAGGLYVRKGTWVKIDPMPQMSGDRPATGTEEIVIAHAPRPNGGRTRWNGGGRPAVYQIRPQDRGANREHPSQKPLSLMEALVRDFTDPGETVLDPFAGSGSTGVACRKLGRAFVGWERDPKYAAIARRRIEETREQLDLEMVRAPKPKQTSLPEVG